MIHKESNGEDYVKVGISEPNGGRKLLTDSEMNWALTGRLFDQIDALR